MTGTRDVTIYTTALCGYCEQARRLLAGKGVDFTEHDVTFDAALRRQMSECAGGRSTVPQIFIGDIHVGGADDLAALEERGELDALLSGETQGNA
jgi:glutaredoxin 3